MGLKLLSAFTRLATLQLLTNVVHGSPSEHPTTSPTMMAPKMFSWEINYLKNKTKILTPNGDLESPLLMMSYNISNRAFKVDVYKSDCKSKYEEDKVWVLNTTNITSGNGFRTVASFLKMNVSRVVSNINDIDEGFIQFCVKSALHDSTEPTAMSEAYTRKTNFTIVIDKTADYLTFTLGNDLEYNKADSEDRKISYDEYVEAYLCNDNKDKIQTNTKFRQGSVFNTCVTSKKPDYIKVEKVITMSLSQNSNQNYFDAVTDGSAVSTNLVQVSDCNKGVCLVKVMLTSRFFEDKEPNDINISGSVLIDIISRGRSLNERDMSQLAKRMIDIETPDKSGSTTSDGGFNFIVELMKDDEADSFGTIDSNGNDTGLAKGVLFSIPFLGGILFLFYLNF